MPWMWGNGAGSFWGWNGGYLGIGLFAFSGEPFFENASQAGTLANFYTYIYDFSNGSITSGSNTYFSQYGGAATSTTTKGYFIAGGYIPTSGGIAGTTNTYTYTYSGNVVTTGPSLAYIAYYSNAAGNSTVGVFALGTGYGNTNVWKYSSNSVTAGSQLAFGPFQGQAAGNSTAGYFSLGLQQRLIYVYTYANNVVIQGTSLISSFALGAAFGNSTVGVFTGIDSASNSATNETNAYLYSSNAVVVGSYLTVATNGGCSATSNQNFGIVNTNISSINNGVNTITNKYVFSSGAVAISTAIPQSQSYGAASSSQNVGVF